MGSGEPFPTSASPEDLDQLRAFARAVSARAVLQEAVARAETPVQIMEIASDCGFGFSLITLRRCARDLCADYWPWAGGGQEARRDFFMAGVNKELPL
jgi:fido (protein-threonine AMPylation protein)